MLDCKLVDSFMDQNSKFLPNHKSCMMNQTDIESWWAH